MTNKTCVCTIIGPRHTGRSFKGDVGNSGYSVSEESENLDLAPVKKSL